MSAKVFGDRGGDLVIAQVHVAAAPLAHGRFGGDGDIELGRAGEADHLPALDGGFFLLFGDWPVGFLDPEVGAASLADGRVRAARFQLFMPALWALDWNPFLFNSGGHDQRFSSIIP
jgi:hypothetical protein